MNFLSGMNVLTGYVMILLLSLSAFALIKNAYIRSLILFILAIITMLAIAYSNTVIDTLD